MKRTSKGASAPKFLVISDSSHYTIYKGTKDQLIAFGVARPDDFPEGRKRVKWGEPGSGEDNFRTEKLKGCRFKLMKWHPVRGCHEYDIPSVVTGFFLFPQDDGRYRWRLTTTRPLDGETNARFTSATYRLLDIASKARLEPVKRFLTLVNSNIGTFHQSRHSGTGEEPRGSKQ
jgi:hypothetical protein